MILEDILLNQYYIPLVEIKNFIALIENKPFFNQPVKTNKKRMKMLLKCQEMITSVFLTNELRVTSYDLRVTVYCTSYELLLRYELRVTIYCTSYEVLLTYEL